MKTTILTSFVTIALFSTTTLATVLPVSTIDTPLHESIPYVTSASRRAIIESVEAKIKEVVSLTPADTLLANVPDVPVERVVDAERRGFFSNVVTAVQPVTETSVGTLRKRLAEDGDASSQERRGLFSNAVAAVQPVTATSVGTLRRHADDDAEFQERRGFFNDAVSAIQPVTATTAATLRKREANDASRKNDDSRDIQHLNLALFMQQLEYAFFERGLDKYSQTDFIKAGFPEWVRGRYVQMKEHEKDHLDFLQSAVTASGGEGVGECDYLFSDNDVHAFVDLSEAITSIVAGAYVGGLHYFNNREYTTVGASILSVESRHASWINSAVRKQHPWNTAFETPLSPNQALTLLTSFLDFDTMPAQNRALLPPNLRPYPKLMLAPRLVPGHEAEISFSPSAAGLKKDERLYAAFLFGFETIFATVIERDVEDSDQKPGQARRVGESRKKYFVQIPKDLEVKGAVYVLVLKSKGGINEVRLDEQSTVAGPAIAMFSFGADREPIAW